MPSKSLQKVKETKKTIFLVDDHPVVRQGLSQFINQEEDMMTVGEAGDAAEAIKGIEKLKPDLVIADISLKGTSGIELTKTILANHPEILVLVISMYDESLYAARALRAGAKGYLMKQEATKNVVNAIRKILSGDVYVSDKMKDSLVHKLVNGGASTNQPSPGSLSDREMEVLQLVGQGFSTKEVASTLFLSAKTVESHYANIKNKLNLKSGHELIQYAIKLHLSENSSY